MDIINILVNLILNNLIFTFDFSIFTYSQGTIIISPVGKESILLTFFFP